MLVFGTLSSAFDFLTFGVLLVLFRADVEHFRTAWFVESVVSASLVVFIVRTRRALLRSLPSKLLVFATVLTIAAAVTIPWLPWAGMLGFSPVPIQFVVAVAMIVVCYLALAEFAKLLFYRKFAAAAVVARPGTSEGRRPEPRLPRPQTN